MKLLFASILLGLLPSQTEGLFATPKPWAATRYRTSVLPNEAATNVDPVMSEDRQLLEHARDCASHFGQCTVEDLEQTRLSLHAERLKNLLTGVSDAAWPEAELNCRALEHDLSLQLDLLKDQIGADEMTMADMEMADARVHHMSSDQMVNDLGTVDAVLQHPQEDDAPIGASELHMRGDLGATVSAPRKMPAVRSVADAVPVPVPLSDAVVPDDHAHWSPWLEDVAVQGWKAFDASTTEAVAIVATVLVIMMLPQTLGLAQM